MFTFLKLKFSEDKKILNNIGWSILDKGFRLIASMIVGIWIARYLGPTQFGLLNYAQVLPASLLGIANLGLTNILVTQFVKENINQQQLLGTAFFLKLFCGTICYLLIIVFSHFYYWNNEVLFLLILFTSSSLIFQAFDTIDIYFQSQLLSKKSVLAKTIGFFLSSLLKLYLLLHNASLFWFSVTILVELMVGSFLLYVFYYQKSKIKISAWKFNLPLAKTLLYSSWYIIVSDFLIFIYMRIDQIMLHNLTDTKQLGLYSAALRLSESWFFLAGAITNSYYPSIALYWLNNNQEFYKKYIKLLSSLLKISILVAVLISLIGNQLVTFLFGNKYEGVGDILVIHVWTGVPIFLGVGCTNLFILNNLQKYSIFRSGFGAILNILLNFILIPKYGAIGASIATLISQIFASYLINILFKQTREVFYIQTKSIVNILK